MSKRKSGEVFRLNEYHLLNDNRICAKCQKRIKYDEWIVHIYDGKIRYCYNGSRISHVKCFVDAKGRPIYDIPKRT